VVETLLTITIGLSRSEPRRYQIYKLYAFVCRYAHQSWVEVEKRTINELAEFAEAVGDIMEEESEQARIETDG